jgi:hypothetical protein
MAYYIVTTSLLPRYYIMVYGFPVAYRWLWVASWGTSSFIILHSSFRIP